MVKVVNKSEEVHVRVPPCFSIISLQTNRPRPVPCFFVVTKGSNIVGRTSSGILEPLLEIVRIKWFKGDCAQEIKMVGEGTVEMTSSAFKMIFNNT